MTKWKLSAARMAVLFAGMLGASAAQADIGVFLWQADKSNIGEADNFCNQKMAEGGERTNTNYAFKGCSPGTGQQGAAIVGRAEWDSAYWGHVTAYSYTYYPTGCPAPLVWNTTTHACEDPGFDPGKNLGPLNCPVATPSPACGNPINSGTSNKFQEETDIPSRGLIEFKRYYNSLSGAPTHLLGAHWTNTYTRRVDYQTTTATVMRPGGATYDFVLVGGEWQPDPDVTATLSRVDGPNGVLLGWTYQEHDGREVERYDALGRLIRIERSDAQSVALMYNNGVIQGSPNDLLVTSVTAQDGRSLSFAYDTALRLSTITDLAGAQIVYQYDALNRLTHAFYPGGGSRKYIYNEPEFTSGVDMPTALTGIVDENGQRYATFAFSANGKAISTEHAGGAGKHVLGYGQGESAVVTLPSGATQQRSFTTLNGIKRIIAESEATPAGTRARTFTYDSNGRTDLTTNASGITNDYDIDVRGLPLQVVENVANTGGVRRTTQTDWHTVFDVPVERRVYDSSASVPGVLRSKSNWSYNNRGQVLTASQVDPTTGSTRLSVTGYCEQSGIDAGVCPLLGSAISVDGPRTDVTDVNTYHYYLSDDPACAAGPANCPHRKGDLWKVTNALGHVTETLRYDGAGRPLSMEDANGVVTDYEYHPRGWLTARKVRGTDSSVESDDAITRIEYQPTGLVAKVTQPGGAFTAYEYDGAHRLTAISNNVGDRIVYTLDGAGNRVKEDTTGQEGTLLRTLSRVYDQLGELQTAADAYANPTDFGYDANGDIDTVIDAYGRTTDNDHDPLGRLARTLQDVAGIAAETKFGYDALDNLTSVIDPKGLVTQYGYNGFGDLAQLTSPDTGVTTYSHDSAGNRLTQTDSRGVTTAYQYDALNRLAAIRYPDASLDLNFYYDAPIVVCPVNEQFHVGRLGKIKTVSGGVSLRYCYDRFGNVTRRIQNTGGKVFTTLYHYTLGGRLDGITYPGGLIVDYQRDALGQIVEIGVTRPGALREVLLHDAIHYPYGPVVEWHYGNGLLMRRSLNQNYQPGFIEGGGVSLGYEFDAVGNLIKKRQATQADPPTHVFGYDRLNRLVEARKGDGTLRAAYTYDATGNRTSFTDGSGTDTYRYPVDSHRLLSVDAAARTYDAAGNTLSINGVEREFVYNDAGRMSQVERNGVVVMNYEYNGKGEQVRRFLGGTSTYFLYDEAGHWLGEYDATGQPTQQVIWLDDLPVGVVADDRLLYIAADALGTPRTVWDPQRGKELWRLTLGNDAFGSEAPIEDRDGDGVPFIFDMRFPGQRYDAASGLNYNRYRDYDMGSGRYIQSDPTGLYGSISTYAYVDSTPLMDFDPQGLQGYTRHPNTSHRSTPRPTRPPVPSGISTNDAYSAAFETADALQGMFDNSPRSSMAANYLLGQAMQQARNEGRNYPGCFYNCNICLTFLETVSGPHPTKAIVSCGTTAFMLSSPLPPSYGTGLRCVKVGFAPSANDSCPANCPR